MPPSPPPSFRAALYEGIASQPVWTAANNSFNPHGMSILYYDGLGKKIWIYPYLIMGNPGSTDIL